MKKPEQKQRLSILALLAAAPSLALAGPQGANVVAGAATIAHPSTHGTVINQASAKAIIDWQSFSIGANEYVQFNQPDSSSISLNRVVGSDPSLILGNLSANGQVFLVNPNGIFFGVGATLDVGGLVASTLDINNDDFLNGNYVFTNPVNSNSSSVVNAGVIQARESGYVVLMGSRVENSGNIETKFGQIALLAGGEVTLDINGDGLVSYSIDAATATELAGVENSGALIADGGRVILAANVSDVLVATAVNNTGLIQANGIEERNGEIYLTGNTDIYNSGVISASGESGGSISLQGKRVAQQGEIRADASVGNAGQVSITADEVIALTNASLTTANAGVNGDGGEVIVYTAGAAIFNYGAQIEAKGGTGSGDGGFVEVSGLQSVEINGFVDASATDGIAGTFLIDPTDINIVSVDTGDTDLGDPGAGDPRVFTNDGGDTNEILDTTIEGFLDGGTSVILQTTSGGSAVGDITVDAQINKAAGGTATLTLQADNDIILNEDIVSTTGALNVVLEADNNIVFNSGADITSNGGNVTITADADGSTNNETITMASDSVINAGTGTISLSADGDIALGQLTTTNTVSVVTGNGEVTDANGAINNITASAVTITSDSGIGAGDALETAASSLDLSVLSAGDIEIDQTGAVDLAGIDTSDGNLSITASGAITTSANIIATDGDVLITTTSDGDITLSNDVTATTSADDDDVSLTITAGGTGTLTQNTMTAILADAGGDDANATLNLSGGTLALNGSSTVEIEDDTGGANEQSLLSITAGAGGVTTSGSLLANVVADGNAQVTITSGGSSTIGNTLTANVADDGNASISIDSATATTVNAVILAESGGPNSQGNASIMLDGDTAVDINNAVTAYVDDDGNATVSIGGTGVVTVGAAVSSTVDGNGDASINIGTMGTEVASATIEAAGSLLLTEGSNGDSETLSIFSAGAINTSGGSLSANDGITLSGASVNVAGLTSATGSISVTADTDDITVTTITADNITITNTGATNGAITTGQLDADNGGITVNAAGAFSTASNTVTATGAIDLDGASVSTGNLESSGSSINVDASTTSVTVGTIDADNDVAITAMTSINVADITVSGSNDDVTLTAGSTLSLNAINSVNRIFLSAGALVSTGSNVYNASRITLAGTGMTGASYDIDTDTADLRITGGIANAIIDNTAYSSMMTPVAVTFSGSNYGSVDIDTNENTNISGALTATGSVDINSGSGDLDVANTISATNGITLSTTAALTSVALTANDVAGATISLAGSTIASGNLTTDATTGTVILDAATISAGAVTTNTLTVSNGGGSATDLSLSGTLAIANTNISVSGSLNLNAVNSSTGITLAANDIVTGGLVITAGNIMVTASGANMGVAVNTGSLTANGAGGTVTVSGTSGSVTSGVISADSTVNIDAGGAVTTAGITTNAGVTLDATSVTAGAITANNLTVQDGAGVNANDLTLTGALNSATAVSLSVVNVLDVQDVTAAIGNVSLTSTSSTVDSGGITSTLGAVNVNANGQFTYAGDITAATGIVLAGNGISGSGNGNVTTTNGNINVTAATGDISVGNLVANAIGASIAIEATTGDASVGALNADTVSIIASSLTLNDIYTNGNFTATNTLTVNGTITNSNILLTATDFLLGNTGILQDAGAGSIITINASDSIVLDGTVNVAAGTFNANIIGVNGSITGSGTSTASTVNLSANGNIGTDAANPLTLNAATVNVAGNLSNAFLDLGAANSMLNVNAAVTNNLEVGGANLTLSGASPVSATDIVITTSGNLSLGQSLNAATSVSLNIAGNADDAGNSITSTTLNLAGVGVYGTTLSAFNSNATSIDINSSVASIVLDNAATATTALNLSGGGTHGTLDISAMGDLNVTAGAAIDVAALSIDTTGALDIAQAITVTSPNALNLQANGIATNGNTLTADAINLLGTGTSNINVTTNTAALNLGTGISNAVINTAASATTALNFNSTNYGDVTVSSDALTINGAVINTGNIDIDATDDITINATLNATAAMGVTTVSLDTSAQLINNGAVTANDATSGSSIVIGSTTAVAGMSGAGQYQSDTVSITGTNAATLTAVTNAPILNVNGGSNLNIDNNAFTGATNFNYGQTNYTSLDLRFGGTATLVGGDITTTGLTSINGQAGLNLNQGYNAPMINLTAGGQVNVTGLLNAATINFAGNGAASFGSSGSKLTTNANLVDLGAGVSNVFINNEMNTGNATLNFSGTNYGIVDFDFGGTSSQVGVATTSTVQGNDFLASALAISGNGNIVVTAGFDVNGGTVPGVQGDTLLTSAVASVGGLINAGGSSDPNASFIATDSVTLNIANLKQSNQYLLIKTDDISFTGTSNAANLLVQLTPFTTTQVGGVDSTLSLNQSAAGTADFNYTFDDQFAPFTGTTIALGEQGFGGNISIGSVNAGSKNLLFLSGGTVTGINNILGTGLLGTADEVGGFFIVRPVITTVTLDQLGLFGFRFGARVSTIELNSDFDATGDGERNNNDLELEDGGVNDGSETQCS